jgi:hypothetical protein
MSSSQLPHPPNNLVPAAPMWFSGAICTLTCFITPRCCCRRPPCPCQAEPVKHGDHQLRLAVCIAPHVDPLLVNHTLPQEVKERFGTDVDSIAAGAYDSWMEHSPTTCLAGIILMDQYTRWVGAG